MEYINDRPNSICTSEIIFNGQAEQGVEFDYVLPDYYPDIFRIISCELHPHIVGYNVTNDNKLILDGVVHIKVLYITENSNSVYCVENRYTYSKTVELGKKNSASCTEPNVTVATSTDYCNCRAVSNRRIDVRGAVSAKIKVSCQKTYHLPEIDDTTQVKYTNLTCCQKELSAKKQTNIREEIDTGSAGIAYIVNCDALPRITDLRIIADKAVLKGSITVNALYGLYDPAASGCTEMEHMTADIPISQIIDIEGLSDEYICLPEITVMNCELSCNESSGILGCELQLLCSINAYKNETVNIPVDAYSTAYETEISTSLIKASAAPRKTDNRISLHTSLSTNGNEIESVWDCTCKISNIICHRKNDSEITVTGQLSCKAMAKCGGGIPTLLEKQEIFEETVSAADLSPNSLIECKISPIDTGYSIKPDGYLDVNINSELSLIIKDQMELEALSSVDILNDKPKVSDREYALRVCYTTGTEDCWSIAKRYNTTVDAIMRDNDLDDESSLLSGMVIIPTI